MPGLFFITHNKRYILQGMQQNSRDCGNQMTNHWHIFSECPVIQGYWLEVHKALMEIFCTDIPIQFEVLYLENWMWERAD